MGDTTAISWADATFNPWIGCTEVDAECDHCYARELAARYGWATWGAQHPRTRTAPATWRKPYQWDRQAAADGVRRRVFCASLADVFDAEVPDAWRADLWQVIRETPHLDWLLLTKRPNRIRRNLPADWGAGWSQVWLGTTVGHQGAVWRLHHLLGVPAAVRFLSCEPLLGPLDLVQGYQWARGALRADYRPPLDWVIAGGESGPHCRPMDWAWARALRAQCAAHGIAFWWKQAGGRRPGTGDTLDGVQYHELPTPRGAVPA